MQNYRVYEFDGYRIEHDERLLRRNGEVVSLPPKAVDLLIALLEDHGRVVSKEELMTSVWTDAVVEEANLSHNIFLLRKALADKSGKFIETVPKRGYRFAAAVETAAERIIVTDEEMVTRIRIEEEIESDPHTAQITERRTSRLKKLLWPSIAIVGIGALVGSAYYLTRKTDVSSAPYFARITNSGKVAAASISPDGKFIAYAQNHMSGEGMVFALQTDTNREIKLIEPAENIFGATGFSPDSRFVYYVAINEQSPRGALYRVPVLGGVSTKLVENSGSWFTISSDGARVAILRKNEDKTVESIVIVDLASGSERVIFSKPISEMDMSGSLAWSPDDRRIIFGADADRRPDKSYLDVKLHELDIETGNERVIADEIWGEIGKAVWLPDGRSVLFVGNRPRVGNQIYIYDTQAGQVRQLTNGLHGYGNYGLGFSAQTNSVVADLFEVKTQLWSIDASGDLGTSKQLTTGETDGRYGLAAISDRRIAYISRVANDFDIWTVNSDGTEAKPITADAVSEHDLATSDDGKYLVFAADRGSGTHLFRSDILGADLKQLTFGDATDGAPDISPDGNWVVYSAWHDNRYTLRKVPIEGGESVQLTNYSSTAPAYSPDGSMIAAILPSDSQARPAGITILSAADAREIATYAVAQFGYWYRAPRWTPDGKSVLFHKDDKHIGNLWSQALAGGAPVQLTKFNTDRIFNYTFSGDGSRIYVSRGMNQVNITLVKNLF